MPKLVHLLCLVGLISWGGIVQAQSVCSVTIKCAAGTATCSRPPDADQDHLPAQCGKDSGKYRTCSGGWRGASTAYICCSADGIAIAAYSQEDANSLCATSGTLQ